MSQVISENDGNPARLCLPFKEKVAYGMGDLGSNILLDRGPARADFYLALRAGCHHHRSHGLFLYPR